MIADPRPLTAPLRVLADPTRLRILALLEREELSVGELGRCLEMSQSRVSNHLRVLREERFLIERHVGPATYLRPALDDEPAGETSDGPRDLKARLWHVLRAELARLPEREADLARLARVVAERHALSRDFFDRVAGAWDKIGVDFATGQARQRALANLLPSGLVVADIGCGTGYLAQGLVGLASRIVLVDASPAMLEEARKNLAPLSEATSVELRQGELEALPIADAELDGLVCGMVLHHLPDLERPLAELRRVLRPGAAAVLVELAPHREAWMHEAQGDRHLGLDPRDVVRALERAGFVDVRLEALDDRYRPARPVDAPESRGPDSRGPGSHADGSRADGAASLALWLVRGRAPASTA